MTTHTKHKPQKPSPEFPLTPHGSGKWCKKIAGKLLYFGTWGDSEGALREYEQFSKGQGDGTGSAVKLRRDPPSVPADFPLYKHKNGQWAKTIRGKKCYFGSISDPAGAKQRYLEQRIDLENGRIPPSLL